MGNLFIWLSGKAELLQELEAMLWELEAASFEVVLIPAQDPKHSGHCIRAKQSSNPKWYEDFAADFTSITGVGRKRKKIATTFIKRKTTLAALERMLEGDLTGIYAERLVRYTSRAIANRKPEKSIPENLEPLYIETGGKRKLCLF